MEPAVDVATPEQSSVTIQIQIRTLDSSNYTVRVDKDVPVPALKDQLAPVVGVPSQNQRLICKGRVLKDDQLLSSYDVEDGHTLHLVARPPLIGTEEPQGSADPASTSSRLRPAHHITHSLLLGTINFPEVAEGGIPDLNRILSAVLNSVGSGSTNLDSRRVAVVPSSGVNATAAATSTTIPEGRRSTDQASESSLFRNLEVVMPDALATISQYLTRMEQAFAEQGYAAPENSLLSTLSRLGQAVSSLAATGASSRPLPTPASLGATISRVHDLLHAQTSSTLANLANQLENEVNITEAAARAELQSTAVWSGHIMQQLGALLMELGRTTLTLRLGPSPSQAVVNSGPAVFVSPSGPNPMMVQPHPFQTGGLPFGSVSLVPQSDPAMSATQTEQQQQHQQQPGSTTTTARRFRLFGSSLHNLHQHSPDAAEPNTADEGVEARQSTETARSDQENGENVGLLVQENGSVRLVPVRTRTTSVNLQSSLLRGLRSSSSEAVTVPVLGIRAQVHAHPWTQAVLQAAEGRPVGLVTVPVDVAASRANGQTDTGVDSTTNVNRTPGQAATSTEQVQDEEERSPRKRGQDGDATESCTSTSEEQGGSGAKRQRV